MKNLFLSISILLISFSQSLHAFTWKSGQNQHVVVSNSEEQVVKTALEMYSNDYKTVFDGNVMKVKEMFLSGQLGKTPGQNNCSVKIRLKLFQRKRKVLSLR